MRGDASRIKGKGFDANPQNINRKGAAPKTMTLILKELRAEGYERVSAAMVLEAYEILLGLPETKIKEIVTDGSQIMSLRIVAKAMLSPKGSEILEKMLDRAHGKATQRTEVKEVQEFSGVDIMGEKQLKALKAAFEDKPDTSERSKKPQK